MELNCINIDHYFNQSVQKLKEVRGKEPGYILIGTPRDKILVLLSKEEIVVSHAGERRAIRLEPLRTSKNSSIDKFNALYIEVVQFKIGLPKYVLLGSSVYERELEKIHMLIQRKISSTLADTTDANTLNELLGKISELKLINDKKMECMKKSWSSSTGTPNAIPAAMPKKPSMPKK